MFMVKRDKNHMLNGNRKLLTKNVFVQNTPPISFSFWENLVRFLAASSRNASAIKLLTCYLASKQVVDAEWNPPYLASTYQSRTLYWNVTISGQT